MDRSVFGVMCLSRSRGVTLVELIVFIVVMSIALVALVRVFNQGLSTSVDPIVQVRALELAQSQLDEILSRKFDENTPTGGVPACNANDGTTCLGITPDSDYDDVGDYNGFSDASYSGYPVSVTVTNAGSDLGLAAADARLITVTVGMPTHSTGSASIVRLSAYRVNF